MSVGNPVLDRDHQTLIALVNQLSLPANGGKTAPSSNSSSTNWSNMPALISPVKRSISGGSVFPAGSAMKIHRVLTAELMEWVGAFLAGKGDVGKNIADFVAAGCRTTFFGKTGNTQPDRPPSIRKMV